MLYVVAAEWRRTNADGGDDAASVCLRARLRLLAGNVTLAGEENSAVMTMLQALLMTQMKEQQTTTIVDQQQAVKMDNEQAVHNYWLEMIGGNLSVYLLIFHTGPARCRQV